MNAETLMLVGGIVSFVLTVQWVRKRDLREKYAVVWLALATVLLLCGLFPKVIMLWAQSVGLSYSAAALFIALAAAYPFAFSVSLSLTRQYRRNIRLMQEIALLQQRIDVLERRVVPGAAEGGR